MIIMKVLVWFPRFCFGRAKFHRSWGPRDLLQIWPYCSFGAEVTVLHHPHAKQTSLPPGTRQMFSWYLWNNAIFYPPTSIVLVCIWAVVVQLGCRPCPPQGMCPTNCWSSSAAASWQCCHSNSTFLLYLLPASKTELSQMKCWMQHEEFSQGFLSLQQEISGVILGFCQIDLFFWFYPYYCHIRHFHCLSSDQPCVLLVFWGAVSVCQLSHSEKEAFLSLTLSWMKNNVLTPQFHLGITLLLQSKLFSWILSHEDILRLYQLVINHCLDLEYIKILFLKVTMPYVKASKGDFEVWR